MDGCGDPKEGIPEHHRDEAASNNDAGVCY